MTDVTLLQLHSNTWNHNTLFKLMIISQLKYSRGCPHGLMVKAMDCGIVVSEFVLQSRYYFHFRANILVKGLSPLILPAMG